jgi:hypothetical protein
MDELTEFVGGGKKGWYVNISQDWQMPVLGAG